MSKAFGRQRALDSVSATFSSGSITGLVGQNGSGKSTLIKILAGVYDADSGELEVDGAHVPLEGFSPGASRKLNLHFVHQDLALVDQLTVAENIGLANGFPTGPLSRLRWAEHRSEVEEMLGTFGVRVDVSRPIGELTSAEQALVAIARAFGKGTGRSEHPTTLILDEPTAALPEGQVEMLFEALRRARERDARIIYVSHRLEEIFAVCDQVVVLRDGRLVHSGEVRTLSEDELIAAIIGGAVGELERRHVSERRPGVPVLSATGVSGRKLSGIDLELNPGEVVGVAGLLGSGRSELARLLAGAQPPVAGEIRMHGRPIRRHGPRQAISTGIAYVPEDRRSEGAIPPMSMKENMTLPRLADFAPHLRLRHEAERNAVSEQIESLGIVPRDPDARLGNLSGGNQQKVVMGKWLRIAPELMILDEPTQGIDVGAKQELLGLIGEQVRAGLAVLFISSEFSEFESLCDRVLILSDGKLVETLAGEEISEHRISESCYRSTAKEAVTSDARKEERR